MRVNLINETPSTRSPRSQRSRLLLTLSLGLVFGLANAVSTSSAGETPAPQPLRVGTSGDYAPFSVATENNSRDWTPEGFDIDVARAYAQDRNLKVQWVRFRWPDLLRDLKANRFDVAMSGVTVRPERSLAGRFSVPVATSGAVALIPEGSRFETIDGLNENAARLAVNHGGHLERVARARFPKAQIIAIPNNRDVLDTLAEGRADAVITDTLEAPHWKRQAPGITQLGPFTQDKKAYLVGPNRRKLATDLDAWLIENEANQTLDALRRQSLGQSMKPPPATPLDALLAAIDERLALMPFVAEAKRRSGRAVEDREREEIVIQSALDATRRFQPQHPLSPTREAALRALFRAQIEAAKDIQVATLAASPLEKTTEPADLQDELRPALGRIGDRIAWLIVQLPPSSDNAALEERTRLALSGHQLSNERIAEIAEAIARIHATERITPRADDRRESHLSPEPKSLQ